MSEPSERLDEIREQLAECERVAALDTWANPRLSFYAYVGYEDIKFLLERVEELEKENKKLLPILQRALAVMYTIRPDTTEEEEALIEEMNAVLGEVGAK